MKVAKSYINYSYDETKAYKKNGKLYVTATCKCDRCTKGIFVCRIENGQPIPHPNAGGICFKCGGSGILQKEIRLYSDEEYEKMEVANEKARLKKKAARQAKIEAEFKVKRAEWITKNGFNENLETYIYFPTNSYDVKEDLKDAGFKFDAVLMWHIPQIPEGYENKVVVVKLDDVIEFAAWGEGHYIIGAKDKIDSIIKAARPRSTSEWIGEVGDRIKEIPVSLVMIRPFVGTYGFSQIIKFETENGNLIKWFTTKDMSDFEIGDCFFLSGTIKDLIEDKYENNAKVTLLTRCKLK